MYVLFDGFVNIVSIATGALIVTLDAGEYFGERRILYSSSTKRAANVVSATISKTGQLDGNSFRVLKEAYPEWKNYLIRRCEEQMKG
jgi:signal-transduction protein with cAMP-binding, CBS, and nucleotidyltransferase domain